MGGDRYDRHSCLKSSVEYLKEAADFVIDQQVRVAPSVWFSGIHFRVLLDVKCKRVLPLPVGGSSSVHVASPPNPFELSVQASLLQLTCPGGAESKRCDI